MSALSKIDALTALASGKTVAYTFQEVETVLDKTWSIESILGCQCDFYIKIETVSIAGMTFLKPFCLEELVDGQEVFIVENFNRVTQTQFDSNNIQFVENAKAGFLQRDRVNASLQIEAIQKALGFENIILLQKGYPVKEEPETKKRASRKKPETQAEIIEEVKTTTPVKDISHQIYIDALNTCVNEDEINNTLRDVDSQGFDESQLYEINIAKQCKISEFILGLDKIDEPSDHQKILDDLLDSAAKAQTPV